MTSYAETYQVGPERTYTNLHQVKPLLLPGDLVEVDGDATYPGNLTFYHGGTTEQPVIVRGIRVNGRRPVITGATVTNVANVVAFRTNHITFEGFEIDGANNPLVVRGLYNVGNETIVRDTFVHDCLFHGIHGSDLSGSLTLDKVEVAHCGSGTDRHSVYVATDNTVYPEAVFRMQFCYIHDANGGNNVKSRAGRNEIYYNWLEGAAYHELDLIGADRSAQAPHTAGLVREDSDVVGNIIYKTSLSHGSAARLGDDGTGSSNARYRFANNTIVLAGYFTPDVFKLRGPRQSVELHNNVIYRNGPRSFQLIDSENPIFGPNDRVCGANNWLPPNTTAVSAGLTGTRFGTDPRLANAAAFDYAPTNGSPLLDAGQLPTESPASYPFINPLPAPLFLPPMRTPPNPEQVTPRLTDAAIDLGAIESAALPPGITGQPVSQSVLLDKPAAFLVTACGSDIARNPLSYQWLFNGTPITDATNADLLIPAVIITDSGLYSVQISNFFGSVTSRDATLTVNLDLTAPIATITYPLQSVFSSSGYLNVAGTASDNTDLHGVLVSINCTDDWQTVTATRVTTSNSVSWYSYVELNPGSNTVYVKALDHYDNASVIAHRHYFYKLPSPFILQISGNGTVDSAASTFGIPTDGAMLDIGHPYQVTAIPAPGNLFSNWVASVNGGPYSEVSTSAKYRFLMQSNLTLIAQFVTNNFLGAAGEYRCLFNESNQVSLHSAGAIKIKVDARRTFTGSISLAGETAAIAGRFSIGGDGLTTQPVQFHSLRDTLTIRLHLPFDGSDTISGSVSNNAGFWVAELRGNRTVFNAAHPAPQFAGSYTLVLPSNPNSTTAPGGDGYGTVKIGLNGLIASVGKLGDGTACSLNAPVSRQGEWPVYCPLYPTTREGVSVQGGMLWGWLTVSNGINGSLAWIKNPLPSDVLYPDGFAEVVNIATSPYLAPVSGERVIEITNGTIILTGGNLELALTNKVFLSTLNKFTNNAYNNLKLILSPKTGLLTGSFTPPDNTNAITPIYGAVLQNTGTGHGCFMGTNQTGAVLLVGN